MSLKKSTLRKFKPTSPGRRSVSLIDKRDLWKGGPISSLCIRGKNTAGRNNRGVITTQGRGGGHKKIIRIIDFHRKKDNMNAVVQRIEYDPGRTAFIALIKYEDGTLSYILCPDNLKVGDTVCSGTNADQIPGNTLPIEYINVGQIIHNVEMQPGRRGKIGRSAGTGITLVNKEDGYATLRLPSKEVRRVSVNCRATIGRVSNPDHMNEVIGKAGNNRWRGRTPKTRGVAKNPVSHRNGGNTPGKRILSNFNGNVIKGKRTRTRTVGNVNIISRRKRKNA